MESPTLKIRAILFDVYGTLLKIGPPRPDAQTRWELLRQARLGGTPRLSLDQFRAEGERGVTRQHGEVRGRGIAYPEFYWPSVVSEVLMVGDRSDNDMPPTRAAGW